jgi:hypothetical protein
MDFYEWISDSENFPLNRRNEKSEYFNSFVHENKDFTNYLKRNTFNIWVNKYANFINANFEQGSSNGLKWFGIFEKGVSYEVETDDDIAF